MALWRLAEGRLDLIDKGAQPTAWGLAAGEAWRAQMAYRDAVTDRLRRDEAEDRVRRNRRVPTGVPGAALSARAGSRL